MTSPFLFVRLLLMPALTGMDPSVALLAAGIGTFIFHGVTGGMVPVFLGSSFAFIGAIILGVFSPIGAFLRTIPTAVMGGVSFILFRYDCIGGYSYDFQCTA